MALATRQIAQWLTSSPAEKQANVQLKQLFLLPLLILSLSPVKAKDSYPPLDILLSTSTSVIGQQFAYPDGQARITSAIVTMVPGQETGWHHHDVPLFAHVLEGELTVDYGPDGTRTYTAGDSFVEAFKTEHNGMNTGKTVTRILAVFSGSDSASNTVAD